jgi:hypothetical protein
MSKIKKSKSAIKSKVTLALAAIALLGAVGYGATVAVAQEASGDSHPLVQALAEKFGLSENEVEEALDEIKADRYAEMQQKKEDMLQDAVDDGVLTEEQKDAWLEKHQEMRQQRMQDREQHREEMDTWFEEQGINHEQLMEYMGGFRKHGGFHKWGTGKTYTE